MSDAKKTVKDDGRPKNTKDVARYLTRSGVRGVKLVKGPGYFCFEGAPTNDWIDHTARVTFLSDLTFEQWLQTFRAMDGNPANRESVLKARR